MSELMTLLREAIGAGRRGPLPGQGRGPGEPWEGLVEETPQVWAVWIAEYWRSKTRRPLPEVPPIWLTYAGQEVRLVGVERRFGYEWMFLCPRCGGMRRALYLTRRGLLCRRCGRLGYLSQARRKERALELGLPLWGRRMLGGLSKALAQDLAQDVRKELEDLFAKLSVEVKDEEDQGARLG